VTRRRLRKTPPREIPSGKKQARNNDANGLFFERERSRRFERRVTLDAGGASNRAVADGSNGGRRGGRDRAAPGSASLPPAARAGCAALHIPRPCAFHAPKTFNRREQSRCRAP
jgi:hypothetical protein